MSLLPRSEQVAPPQIATISPRRITVYTDRSAAQRDQILPRETDQNLTRGIYNGYISPATRRHIRRTVGTWIRSIWHYRTTIKKRWDPGKPYPIFLTLTLPSPQVHDDREINRKCLQPFLQQLKRQHGITHYFYRAEAQENGNLHYHILTDRYIDKGDLQIAWNKCLNVLGYEDRYYETTGQINPPSTDVHRMVDKIKDKKTGEWRSVDPIEYLLDYVTDCARLEEDDDPLMLQPAKPRILIGKYRQQDGTVITYTTRPISGRVWGMSDPVREVKEPRMECTPQIWGSLKKATERGELREVVLDHATLFFGPIHDTLRRSRGWLSKLIDLHHIHTFHYLYPTDLPPDWITYCQQLNTPDLWIDTRHRKLSSTPPPGAYDHMDYMPTEEDPQITDLRRALVGPKCTPNRAQRLIDLACKYLFN